MIKQFVPERVCLTCQGCCRFQEADSVWSPCLLDNEIQGLFKNGILPLAISSSKRIRLIPNTTQDNFVCTFLNPKDNKCKVYSLRPFECQLYPFLISRKENKIFLALDLKCPFVKERLKGQGLKEYVKDLTGILNSPSFKQLLKNNPQIIQVYPEALNLAELKL